MTANKEMTLDQLQKSFDKSFKDISTILKSNGNGDEKKKEDEKLMKDDIKDEEKKEETEPAKKSVRKAEGAKKEDEEDEIDKAEDDEFEEDLEEDEDLDYDEEDIEEEYEEDMDKADEEYKDEEEKKEETVKSVYNREVKKSQRMNKIAVNGKEFRRAMLVTFEKMFNTMNKSIDKRLRSIEKSMVNKKDFNKSINHSIKTGNLVRRVSEEVTDMLSTPQGFKGTMNKAIRYGSNNIPTKENILEKATSLRMEGKLNLNDVIVIEDKLNHFEALPKQYEKLFLN